MFKRIIVPLDGTKSAEQAIPVAARITRASKGTIVFVNVVLPPVEFGTYTEDRTVALKPTAFQKRLTGASDYLTQIVDAHESDLAEIDVVVKVVSGAASPAIFSAVNMEHGDLIVMYSHEESGLKRWMFGSVALEAVRHSPVPVLVLHEHAMLPAQSDQPLHILVVLDGSPLAETAVEPAAQLVSLLSAPAHGALHLLRVVDIPTATGKYRGPTEFDDTVRGEALQEAETYLKDVTDRVHGSLADLNLTLTSSAVLGTNVVETIIQQAEQGGGSEQFSASDLIAMTSHGHTGLLRLIMGNVTEKILESAQLPLLIVRHHETKTQG